MNLVELDILKKNVGGVTPIYQQNAFIKQQNTMSQGNFNLISREELRRLACDQGKSDAEIADMYGVSANQVNRKRRLMNLLQGEERTTQQLIEIVQLTESIKKLPFEAIEEIKEVVGKYTL